MASAVACSLPYCVHTLKLNALRGRSVAFLAFVAASTSPSSERLSPTVVVTVLGLLGTLTGGAGNEASIRFGRRRLVAAAMLLSILVGALIGFVGSIGIGSQSRWWWSTARSYGSIRRRSPQAPPGRPTLRAAAPHSPCIRCWATPWLRRTARHRWILDLAGGMSLFAWRLCFAVSPCLWRCSWPFDRASSRDQAESKDVTFRRRQ